MADANIDARIDASIDARIDASIDTADLRLVQLPYVTQLNIRLDPKSPAADAVALALDLSLPTEPNTTATHGDLTALWLGPDEWLLTAPPGTAADLEARIRTAGAGAVVSVTDVSANRTTLLVTGPRARDLLAHGCALDLHPRAFGPGRCAQTMLARAQVVLIGQEGGFRVLVRSSFAGYLTDWLQDAATEYVRTAGGRAV
jgi:sarcosine oxidase subunit gamma